ncbi:MAG: RNA polymerase sigma factor [Thermoleophilaceae bacterium]
MTPRRLIEPARLAGTALLHTQTDERLVDLTRAGNGRAFEAIVARYRRQLLRYCARILPPERAEDAVQQAFLNAYKAILADEAELKLRPWLYRIAHNAALNLLRQNGWNYDQIPEDFDGVMQPPQAVEQSERIRQVVRNVQELPERQRDAIVLREMEGRSYEEIALALGVSDGAVRQLLNRARTTLRAAATAITPPQLVSRIAERAAMDSPATRIAEISAAGAGGAMTLAKFGTVVVVAGAVAGGMGGAPLHSSKQGRTDGDVAQAAEAAVRRAGLGGPVLGGHGRDPAVLRGGRGHHDVGVGRAVGTEAQREHRRHGSAFELGDDGGGSRGGPGAGGLLGGDGGGRDGGEHSGSDSGSGGDGGADHSGSGRDGGGSGSGDGGGDPVDDHPGPGDGSGSVSDGGGSSGSGSSGSGDDGGSSGSGSSGSGDGGGTSGSGSGSGSGDSGSSGSGSGSGDSGSFDSGSSSGDGGSGISGSGDLGSSGSGSSGPGSGLPSDG